MSEFVCLLVIVSFLVVGFTAAEKPKLVPLPKTTDSYEKKNYRLLCSIESGDPPFTFKWSKDNQPLRESQQLRIKIGYDDDEGSSLLTIKNLTSTDSGTFTCQVANAFGSDQSSSLLRVKGLLLFVNKMRRS